MTVSTTANLQLIYVSDIGRSTAFYKSIFKVEPVFTSPRYVSFPASEHSSDALFSIWSGGGKPDASVPRYSEIGIMVPSSAAVDRVYEEWRHNPDVKIVREPYDEVFGRTFLLKDPDGHIIRVSPRD